MWDQIEENAFADTVTEALVEVFPANPPRFLAKTPHKYWSVDEINTDLAAAGFTTSPNIVTMATRSKASSPTIPTIAYCQGTPLRNKIESRNATLLEYATEVAATAVSERFGAGAVDGKIQAHVVSAQA